MHHVQLAHEHVVCHGSRGARNLILTSGHRQDRETFTAGVGLSARLAEEEEEEAFICIQVMPPPTQTPLLYAPLRASAHLPSSWR